VGNVREPGPSAQLHGPARERDLGIDLVRFICLALVVVGHCMMVSPVLHADGTVTSENTLGNQRWFEPVIWIFMVMPLFFVTGGTTGLQSWQRLKASGGNGFEFAQARLLRLVRPAAALLAVMFLGLWAALLVGVDTQVVQLIATGAGMPLWFLAAYLAAQLNIPLLARFHARAPWLTVAALAALVIAVDCLRGALPLLAYANLVFLWCAVQQLGFLTADGHAARLSRSAWWDSSWQRTWCSVWSPDWASTRETCWSTSTRPISPCSCWGCPRPRPCSSSGRGSSGHRTWGGCGRLSWWPGAAP
jgi:hypothetical protein